METLNNKRRLLRKLDPSQKDEQPSSKLEVLNAFKDMDTVLMFPNGTKKQFVKERQIQDETIEKRERDILIKSLKSRWMMIRKTRYLRSDNDIRAHSCVEEKCRDKGNIINFVGDCFGCLDSGEIHLCDGKENCRYSSIDNAGLVICFISGYERGCLYRLEGDFYSVHSGKNYSENGGDEDDNEAIVYEETFENEERPEKKKKTKKKPVEIRNIDAVTRRIVEDLLYNEEERRKITLEKKASNDGIIQKNIWRYFRDCCSKGLHPSSSVTDSIIYNVKSNNKELSLLKYEQSRISFIIDAINAMWVIIHKSDFYRTKDTKFNAKQHVLGCLYILNAPSKTTHFKNSINYDEFLHLHLPSQNDLCRWNREKSKNNHVSPIQKDVYRKNDITTGRNNIKQAISSMEQEKRMKLFEKLVDIRNRYSTELQFPRGYMPFYGLFSNVE